VDGHAGHGDVYEVSDGSEVSWSGLSPAGRQPPTRRRPQVYSGRVRRRRRQARRPWYVREAVLALPLMMITIGLVAVSQDYWRRGLLVVGSALVAAGVLRLVLPTRAAGLLAVRSRVFDVVMLVVLGFAVVGLTLAVPVPGSS
jgi:hypothetical protein